MGSKMGGIWATRDLGDCNKTDFFFKLRFSPLFIFIWVHWVLVVACGILTRICYSIWDLVS